MSRPNQAARAKRDREMKRRERKEEKKIQKLSTREAGQSERAKLLASGVDPDLVGIHAGPQPIADSD